MKEYTTTWQLMFVKLQKRTTKTLHMQNNVFFWAGWYDVHASLE